MISVLTIIPSSKKTVTHPRTSPGGWWPLINAFHSALVKGVYSELSQGTWYGGYSVLSSVLIFLNLSVFSSVLCQIGFGISS